MSNPQIWFGLFTFRPIASKNLNGLTIIDTFSWLGGAVVTHSLWVQEVPVQSPAPAMVFMFDLLFCCCCVFTFLSKNTFFVTQVCNSFYIFIYLVYLKCCKIYDRLSGYKDPDLTSLTVTLTLSWHSGNMGYAHPLVEMNVSFKFEGNPSISKGVIERTRHNV